MLTSLFGDLPPARLPDTPAEAALGGLPTVAAPTRHAPSVDLLVDDSPTEAVRAHLAASRPDLQRASAMLTLLDPSRLWAPQVVQALAAAGGQPVQRLNLRERSSLRTLAVIERALVPRRDGPALRVYHADIRGGASASGVAPEEITGALAESSQLTAVIVGAMQPHALVALLRGLLQACQRPEWRCPHLVFLLPPGAAALRERILSQPWPAGVKAHALAEPLGHAASVWNHVLDAWDRTCSPGAGGERPGAPGTAPGAAATASGRPDRPERSAAPATATAPGRPADPRPDGAADEEALPPLTPVLLNRLLLPLARSEGLLACGIVHLHDGDLLASQQRDQPATDVAALAEALCAARLAHQAVAPDEAPPDEILVTTGARQSLLRRLPGERPLGFVAVLDRQQANLALLRFKLLDAERLLG